MLRRSGAARALITAAFAAAVVGLVPRSAQGAGPGDRAAAPVAITYTYPYFTATAPRDLPAVQDAINAILAPRINVTVQLQAQSFAAFDQKMRLMFAAGQSCDVVFTAPWTNNFYQLVANGDLIPLTRLLPTLAPKTYASLPAAAWKAATVNGQIYGVINQQMFPVFWGLQVRRDLATKYHLSLAGVRALDDVTPILARLKAADPAVTPLVTDDTGGGVAYQPETYGLDPVLPGSQNIFIAAVGAPDRGLRVVDPSETPAFKHAAEVAWKWHQAGYTPRDLIPSAQATAEFQAGKFGAVLGQARPSAAEAAKSKAGLGYDMVGQSFTKPILTTRSVTSTMSGICRTSAHPEAAMRFLELLNTDKQVYNLMAHGIPGKDYVVVDKANGVIGLPPGATVTSDGYYPNTDWEFGNQFNAYYTDRSQIGSWAIQQAVNRQATPSVALGFAPSTASIKTQVAQVTAAIQQYGEPLVKGLVDPATGLPAFIHALKAAGEDQILANLQAQINTWKATNK